MDVPKINFASQNIVSYWNAHAPPQLHRKPQFGFLKHRVGAISPPARDAGTGDDTGGFWELAV